MIGLSENEKREKLKIQKDILIKVGEVLNDEELVSDIIERFGTSEFGQIDEYKEALLCKDGVTLQEYEIALSFTSVGYKVVHERDITEVFINT